MEIDKGFTDVAYSDGEYVFIPIGLTSEELKRYVKTLEDNGWKKEDSDVETVKWWIHDVIHDRIMDLGYSDPSEDDDDA